MYQKICRPVFSIFHPQFPLNLFQKFHFFAILTKSAFFFSFWCCRCNPDSKIIHIIHVFDVFFHAEHESDSIKAILCIFVAKIDDFVLKNEKSPILAVFYADFSLQLNAFFEHRTNVFDVFFCAEQDFAVVLTIKTFVEPLKHQKREKSAKLAILSIFFCRISTYF